MALSVDRPRSDKEKCLQLLTVNGKGWNTAIFKENHSKCAACHHVCRDPVELGCDHPDSDIYHYCNDCLMELIDNASGRCPINGHRDPIVLSLRGQRRQTAKAPVICPHSLPHKAADEGRDVGCQWEGTLTSLIENHLTKCTKQNDPAYLLNLQISELQRAVLELQKENESLKEENNSLKAENQSLKSNNVGQSHHQMQYDVGDRYMSGTTDESLKRRNPGNRKSPPPLDTQHIIKRPHRQRAHFHDFRTLVFIGGISKQCDVDSVLRRIEEQYRVRFNNWKAPSLHEGQLSDFIKRIPLATAEMAEKLVALSPLNIEIEPRCGVIMNLHVRRARI